LEERRWKREKGRRGGKRRGGLLESNPGEKGPYDI
jgi:hypothetical protein